MLQEHAPPTPGRVILDAGRLLAKLLPVAIVLALVSVLTGGNK